MFKLEIRFDIGLTKRSVCHLWTVMIVVPSVWMLLAFPPCPESPRFLMVTKNDGDEAEKGTTDSRLHDLAVSCG